MPSSLREEERSPRAAGNNSLEKGLVNGSVIMNFDLESRVSG